MKVVIVGAGMQGHVITWNLGRNPAVSEILVADYDEDRAKFIADRVGNGKATGAFIDASDTDGVAKAGEGAKLIVNAVIPEYNMAIMRACLKCGAAYLDMASGQTSTKTIDDAYLEQTTLADDFAKAGITALLNTGMDPGVTNTFASMGYQDLDTCFEIRIKDYALFDSPVPLQVWSQETYYMDCAQPPLIYEDGQFKRVEIFGRREKHMFPEPFGLGTVICHDHEEVVTLPRLLPKRWGDKGLRHVEFKMGTDEASIDADYALVSSGMTSKYPVKLKDGTEVRPIDVFVATLPPNPPMEEIAKLALAGEITDYGVVTVDCIGEKGGKPASVTFNIFPPDIKWVNSRIPGATCVSYGTSTPASIYAEFIVEDRITDTGLLCPEVLPRSVQDAFCAECVKRDMPITRTDTAHIA
ncbi:MAG TPA: saccharopine dehydrogenase NADP-binding domain-containing protein [Thermoleophilia bacterium]|nr:saccharopine dehydrogenase NADP-binding domain-containing protein [Thermoleophilia bacterium]HQG02731.1 saccharopine dehydrogenase NADP-binding domain-containing protein [Thermoleophilia bacterium]HQG54018.1 saccharopine dehydrogenase NADP-binding domain-containing protein [Thermoleophilia bacterium]HQJ97096.1 saccharopine dehydrogenase NADP-binding domain-containing protein [Thermoleophilia bacterium]